MRAADIRLLFEYNAWANALMFQAAEKFDKDLFVAQAGLSHGSLRGTLVHMLSAEWIWRMRLQESVSPRHVLHSEDFRSVTEIRERAHEEDMLMANFLGNLTDGDLMHKISYADTRGRPCENVLWHLLVHVVNHGTQCRSEASVFSTEHGSSPGDIDLISFLGRSASS